jgi:hypothetical protein
MLNLPSWEKYAFLSLIDLKPWILFDMVQAVSGTKGIVLCFGLWGLTF